MQLVPLQCPSCGGNLEIDPNNHSFKCPFCGVTSVTKDAIVHHYVTNILHITIQTDPSQDRRDFDIVAGTLKKYTGREIDVTIPDDVISIGEGAFYSQSNLRSVVFPQGLKTIERNAFLDCKSLNTLDFPDSLEIIGSQAFQGCNSVTTIRFPNGLHEIGGAAFCLCSALKTVTIPKSLTIIYSSTFSGCTSLESVLLL